MPTNNLARKWRPARTAIAAAVVVVVAVGGAVAVLRSGSLPSAEVVTLSLSAPDDCYSATTLPADGSGVPCPPPESVVESAVLNAMTVLGVDGFGGAWLDNDGSELVVAVVDSDVSIDDLPGVERLVQREQSLRELEYEAAARTAAETDSSYVWVVDVPEGILVRRQIVAPTGDDEVFCQRIDTSISSGELMWDEMNDIQIEEISNRCGFGPPL